MPNPNQAIVHASCQQIRWEDLDLKPIHALIDLAVAEDLQGSGLKTKPDQTGDASSALLPSGQHFTATLKTRGPMTLCGARLAPEVLAAFHPQLKFEALAHDGDILAKGDSIGTLSGPARSALAAERPLLNFMQRLSGIASTTHTYVAALGNSATRLLDTRKTTPGYRYLEKYAVACGGGWNHRMGLFDRVMLKDNHLSAFGDDLVSATRAAVEESRRRAPNLLIEMEVDRIDQIEAALQAGVDIILLDNFTTAQLHEAQQLISHQAVTEISGNVTLDTLFQLKDIGCDFISTGALVHKSVWVDIGLDSD
ncbi:MAG: carboxylating nicotinate-nucleotide diphosphorylase [Verrucomicrobiia bacterium]